MSNSSSQKKFIFHLPWLLWVIVISLLSFLPGDQLPEIKWTFISIDTVVHFGMYLLLSVFLVLGFDKRWRRGTNKKMNPFPFKLYLMIVLVGIAFGIFVELVQGSFIYRRYFDLLDIAANSVGTIFGMLIAILISRKLV